MKKIIVAALGFTFIFTQINFALAQGVAPSSNKIVPVAPAPAPAAVAVAPAPAPVQPAPAVAPTVQVPATSAASAAKAVPVAAVVVAVPANTTQAAAKPAATPKIKYKITHNKEAQVNNAENKVSHKSLSEKDFVDENHYDKNKITKLTFSETVKVEVEPDYHNAILHFEVSGEGEFSQMQNQLNEAMQKALAITKEYSGFKIETKDYTVMRNYADDSDKDLRWTVSQKISIDTRNKTQLLSAVARIQAEGFALDRLTSYLSDERKSEYKNQLTDEALSIVKARAYAVAKTLDKRTVKFSEIRIDADNIAYQFNYDVKVSMMKSASVVATPVLESANKIITLTLTVEALLI